MELPPGESMSFALTPIATPETNSPAMWSFLIKKGKRILTQYPIDSPGRYSLRLKYSDVIAIPPVTVESSEVVFDVQ